MSLECEWRDLAREAPVGLATMRRQWAEAGAVAAG